MKVILYLGLEAPQNDEHHAIHCPIIQTVPRSPFLAEIQEAFAQLDSYTHILFTSKTTVNTFYQILKALNLSPPISQTILAIGQSTAKLLKNHTRVHFVAKEETAEGMIQVIQNQKLTAPFFFLPQSSIARPILRNFFEQKNFRHHCCPIYDTHPRFPPVLPDLSKVDEIVFTSPSTVDAFLKVFGSFPKDKVLRSIGPITKAHLEQKTGLIQKNKINTKG